MKRFHLHDFGDDLDLNEGDLEPDRYEEHDNEEHVVEEACEDVDLLWQQLLGIDLVEDLQHHVHVEEERVVAAHARVPLYVRIPSELIIIGNNECSISISIGGLFDGHVSGDIATRVELREGDVRLGLVGVRVLQLHLGEPVAVVTLGSLVDEVEAAGVVVAEIKQEAVEEEDLVDGLADDVAPHDRREDGVLARVGLLVEEGVARFLSGQGHRGESVHQDVHPEQLQGSQRLCLRWA